METISMNLKDAQDLALLMYVGEKCTECGHTFSSLEDLKEKNLICSGKNPLRFACKKCFENNNQTNVREEKKKMENDQVELVPNFDFESQLETDLEFGLELPVMDFEASTLTEL